MTSSVQLQRAKLAIIETVIKILEVSEQEIEVRNDDQWESKMMVIVHGKDRIQIPLSFFSIDVVANEICGGIVIIQGSGKYLFSGLDKTSTGLETRIVQVIKDFEKVHILAYNTVKYLKSLRGES